MCFDLFGNNLFSYKHIALLHLVIVDLFSPPHVDGAAKEPGEATDKTTLFATCFLRLSPSGNPTKSPQSQQGHGDQENPRSLFI